MHGYGTVVSSAKRMRKVLSHVVEDWLDMIGRSVLQVFVKVFSGCLVWKDVKFCGEM